MPDLPPFDPGLQVVVASRGISKGLAQTDGPQLLARGYVGVGSVQVGAQYKNITSPVAEGEAALFATVSPKLGRLGLSFTAARKFQTGVEAPADTRAWEFTAVATHPVARGASLKASAVFSPDDLGSTGKSLYIEGGASVDLVKGLTLSGNVARRERNGAPDYTSFNLGALKALTPNIGFDLRYYDTAQGQLGETYHNRVVASVLFKI